MRLTNLILFYIPCEKTFYTPSPLKTFLILLHPCWGVKFREQKSFRYLGTLWYFKLHHSVIFYPFPSNGFPIIAFSKSLLGTTECPVDIFVELTLMTPTSPYWVIKGGSETPHRKKGTRQHLIPLTFMPQPLCNFSVTFLLRIPNNWVSFVYVVPSLFISSLRWLMDVPDGTDWIIDPVGVLWCYTSTVETSHLFLPFKQFQSLRLLLFPELLHPKLVSN